MRRWTLLLLLLVVCVAPVMLAGDVQVNCEPGLLVYLDGKLVGTSNAKEDGLFLAKVPEGTHVIRVWKEGFGSQTFNIFVTKAPVEVKVGAFAPLAPVPREREGSPTPVAGPAGTLHITSAPQNCAVEIDGRSEIKSIPVLRIDGLSAGDHAISFSKAGYEKLTGVVKVAPGGALTVHGDLMAGKVEMVYEGQGSLRVYSTPEHCTVHILGMSREKTRATLNLSHLPAGEHRLVVGWAGHEQSTSIVISSGLRTIVTVSFVKGAPPFAVKYEPE